MAGSCLHACTVDRPTALLDGTVRRLNLLNLLNDTQNYLFSRSGPRGQSRHKKRRAFNDLVSVFCDWVSLEWMFFNTTCFRSGVKVVTWPEGAQRLGKKPWLIRLFVAARLTGGGKLQSDLIHFGLSNDERKLNEKAKKMEIEGSISYIYVDAWWSIWIGIHNR